MFKSRGKRELFTGRGNTVKPDIEKCLEQIQRNEGIISKKNYRRKTGSLGMFQTNMEQFW